MLNTVLKLYLKRRASRFAAFSHQPELIQETVLKGLLKSGGNTEFAKTFGIQSNSSLEQFQNNVPLFTYDEIKPFIQRAIDGEESVLWPGKLKWLAKSSGTSSDKSKYIPVTYQFLSDTLLQGGRDALALYTLQRPEHKLFNGKGLIMGGSHELLESDFEIRTGDVSAVMIQNMPAIAKYFLTPKLDIALLGDWERKMSGLIECGNENVTNISGVPTWTLVLIRRLLEQHNAQKLDKIWPNLELYVHGGVNFQPYRDEFEKLMGHKTDFLEVYNASEGFFAIQDKLNDSSMLLMLDYGVFYEFVPLEELEKESPRTLLLSEVELQKDYALYITTSSGLWRYQVGDTIRFTSLKPPRIQISGRVQAFINMFGEELMQHQTDKAILHVCRKQGAFLRDYIAAPIYMREGKNGGHEWIIELDKIPNDKEFWVNEFDRALKKLNSDYEAKRSADIALSKPNVHFVKQGFFDNWLKNKGKLGGQHKVPRLRNDRKLLEDMLLFSEAN